VNVPSSMNGGGPTESRKKIKYFPKEKRGRRSGEKKGPSNLQFTPNEDVVKKDLRQRNARRLNEGGRGFNEKYPSARS